MLYSATGWVYAVSGYYRDVGSVAEATITHTVTIEPVEQCDYSILTVSAAINGFDQAQASYACGQALRHSYQPDSWLSSSVGPQASSPYVDAAPALAIDHHNLPGISYVQSYQDPVTYTYSYALAYAYWPGSGPWRTEMVDYDVNTGSPSALVFDSTSQPHIVYYDAANKRLRYATRTASGWRPEYVDAQAVVGPALALAIDAQDQPHIAYYDAATGAIKYARRDGAAWDIQTVDQVGPGGSSVDLALDSAGLPHLAYSDPALGDLKYAVGTPAVLSPASWLPLVVR